MYLQGAAPARTRKFGLLIYSQERFLSNPLALLSLPPEWQ